MKVPIPPDPLQTAFAERVARLAALAGRLDAAATHVDHLAASLSAPFFDEQGEMRAPPPVPAPEASH